MAVITREQLMEKIRARVGDATDDETISLVEDINDTINDYDSRLQQVGDYKKMYEENDAAWRKRYRDRFFEGDAPENDNGPSLVDEEEVKNLTYENLFYTAERS